MTRTAHTDSRWLALPLAALLVLAGCAGSDGAPADEPAEAPPTEAAREGRSIRVETLLLRPTAFEDVVEITGAVEATNDAVLSAQSAGTVTYLAPRGRLVRAGEAVAQLEPRIAQAGVEQARAQVQAAQAQFDLAEDNFRRQEPLYRDSVISALEFESVRAQLNQARAALAQARAGVAQAEQGLRNTRVVSPFAGVVEDRLVEPGEQVAPGVPVARVVNTGTVKVVAGVPERYAADIDVGTPVQVSFQAYGPERRLGRVSFVGSAVNPQNRTFPVELELVNTDGRLKPEMVAKVYVTREELDQVLVVPRSAVVRDEDGTYVYVAAPSGDGRGPVAERRDVVLGSSYGGQTVVSSGLRAGDEVIVLGQNNVTQGDALQVVEQHTSPAAADAPLALEEDLGAGR